MSAVVLMGAGDPLLVARAALASHFAGVRVVDRVIDAGDERVLVFAGIGAGCAELAAALGGPEVAVRVAAVVLIAPDAPWAERDVLLCGRCEQTGGKKGCGCEACAMAPISCGDAGRLPLGPLEPLRAWAERARERCPDCYGVASLSDCAACEGLRTPCDCHASAVRLIITAHPEPVKCGACGGRGWHSGECHPREECSTCSGTGRSLGPADVAAELCAFEVPRGVRGTGGCGGVRVFTYATRADHNRDAIGAALACALEGLR